jgi:hypothetical protein
MFVVEILMGDAEVFSGGFGFGQRLPLNEMKGLHLAFSEH